MNVSYVCVTFGDEQYISVRRFSGPTGFPPFQITGAVGTDMRVASATELLAIYQAIGTMLYGIQREVSKLT